MQAKYRLAMALGLISVGVSLFAIGMGAYALFVLSLPGAIPTVGILLCAALVFSLFGAGGSFYHALCIGFKAINDLVNNRDDGNFYMPAKDRKEEFHQEVNQPSIQASYPNSIEMEQTPGKAHENSPPSQSQRFFNSLNSTGDETDEISLPRP